MARSVQVYDGDGERPRGSKKCPTCRGQGSVWDSNEMMWRCSDCRGTGIARVSLIIQAWEAEEITVFNKSLHGGTGRLVLLKPTPNTRTLLRELESGDQRADRSNA